MRNVIIHSVAKRSGDSSRKGRHVKYIRRVRTKSGRWRYIYSNVKKRGNHSGSGAVTFNPGEEYSRIERMPEGEAKERAKRAYHKKIKQMRSMSEETSGKMR